MALDSEPFAALAELKPAVRLTTPAGYLLNFFKQIPVEPQTLPVPPGHPTLAHPFNIPNGVYNAALSPAVPLTIALVYLTVVSSLNRVNKSREYKPWTFSKSYLFKLGVITHNAFLTIYSAWTFIGMFNALRNSIYSPLDKFGLAGTVDSFCKINGPRGFGSAATYSDQSAAWSITNRFFHLGADGLTPDVTDVGRMWNEGLAFYGWLFYLSKFYEVIDTAIILAKGKKSSFLQTYHHAGAMICMWAGIRYMSPPIWMFVLVNSFIHTIMYAFYFCTALRIRVPVIFKRTLTTMQITQFVVGANYAFLHPFVKYQSPISVPYLYHLGDVASTVASDATSAASIATASASADVLAYAKKALLRAAGREGLAENVLNDQGQAFGIDAVNAAKTFVRREELRYKDELTWTPCLDTSGQTFAIFLNVVYLAPLTWLFVRFFIKSYLRRLERRRSSTSKEKAQLAAKSGRDAWDGAGRRLSHAFEHTQGPLEDTDNENAVIDDSELEEQIQKAKEQIKGISSQVAEDAQHVASTVKREVDSVTSGSKEGMSRTLDDLKDDQADSLKAKAEQKPQAVTEQAQESNESAETSEAIPGDVVGKSEILEDGYSGSHRYDINEESEGVGDNKVERDATKMESVKDKAEELVNSVSEQVESAATSFKEENSDLVPETTGFTGTAENVTEPSGPADEVLDNTQAVASKDMDLLPAPRDHPSENEQNAPTTNGITSETDDADVSQAGSIVPSSDEIPQSGSEVEAHRAEPAEQEPTWKEQVGDGDADERHDAEASTGDQEEGTHAADQPTTQGFEPEDITASKEPDEEGSLQQDSSVKAQSTEDLTSEEIQQDPAANNVSDKPQEKEDSTVNGVPPAATSNSEEDEAGSTKVIEPAQRAEEATEPSNVDSPVPEDQQQSWIHVEHEKEDTSSSVQPHVSESSVGLDDDAPDHLEPTGEAGEKSHDQGPAAVSAASIDAADKVAEPVVSEEPQDSFAGEHELHANTSADVDEAEVEPLDEAGPSDSRAKVVEVPDVEDGTDSLDADDHTVAEKLNPVDGGVDEAESADKEAVEATNSADDRLSDAAETAATDTDINLAEAQAVSNLSDDVAEDNTEAQEPTEQTSAAAQESDAQEDSKLDSHTALEPNAAAEETSGEPHNESEDAKADDLEASYVEVGSNGAQASEEPSGDKSTPEADSDAVAEEPKETTVNSESLDAKDTTADDETSSPAARDQSADIEDEEPNAQEKTIVLEPSEANEKSTNEPENEQTGNTQAEAKEDDATAIAPTPSSDDGHPTLAESHDSQEATVDQIDSSEKSQEQTSVSEGSGVETETEAPPKASDPTSVEDASNSHDLVHDGTASDTPVEKQLGQKQEEQSIIEDDDSNPSQSAAAEEETPVDGDWTETNESGEWFEKLSKNIDSTAEPAVKQELAEDVANASPSEQGQAVLGNTNDPTDDQASGQTAAEPPSVADDGKAPAQEDQAEEAIQKADGKPEDVDTTQNGEQETSEHSGALTPEPAAKEESLNPSDANAREGAQVTGSESELEASNDDEKNEAPDQGVVSETVLDDRVSEGQDAEDSEVIENKAESSAKGEEGSGAQTSPEAAVAETEKHDDEAIESSIGEHVSDEKNDTASVNLDKTVEEEDLTTNSGDTEAKEAGEDEKADDAGEEHEGDEPITKEETKDSFDDKTQPDALQVAETDGDKSNDDAADKQTSANEDDDEVLQSEAAEAVDTDNKKADIIEEEPPIAPKSEEEDRSATEPEPASTEDAPVDKSVDQSEGATAGKSIVDAAADGKDTAEDAVEEAEPLEESSSEAPNGKEETTTTAGSTDDTSTANDKAAQDEAEDAKDAIEKAHEDKVIDESEPVRDAIKDTESSKDGSDTKSDIGSPFKEKVEVGA